MVIVPSQKWSAAGQALELGEQLAQQRDDETEDEKRRKKLGLGTLDGNPLNFDMSGVASSLSPASAALFAPRFASF